MSKQKDQGATYVVRKAVQSAIGDYARVSNYLSPQAAEQDPGMAGLRILFQEINRRLEKMDPEDREQIAVEVEQAAKLAAEIQQGDASAKKQAFLEARLKNIANMAPDIGQVMVATMASPPAGVALVIQKIAQKAQSELGKAGSKK